MDSFKDSLAYWSSILGTVLSLVGLLQSSPWFTTVGILLLATSVVAIAYAARQRQRLRLATVRIEGRSIDALNLASLRRRLNTSLFVQECDQVVFIEGEDMTLTWKYVGYCRAPHESAVDFSVDAENNIPFEHLQCFAYDLQHDPTGRHPIKPILLSDDGLSKKISVPFLEPLSHGSRFKVMLTCTLSSCMKSGVEYYTSTISVAQDRVSTTSTRLVFPKEHPEWMRVYECETSGVTRLLRELRPSRATAHSAEYFDLAADVSAQSARIYVFRRTEARRGRVAK